MHTNEQCYYETLRSFSKSVMEVCAQSTLEEIGNHKHFLMLLERHNYVLV